jgi:ribonuclease HI
MGMPADVGNRAEVCIHTDGSCLGNPGPGGWGVRLACNGKVKLLSGGFARTTNNRMELYAAVMALEALVRPCSVTLYTDSRYLRDAVEKRWLASWQRKNWKKADGRPVLNKDLWERFAILLNRHSTRLHWVEGHAGHAENEEVDALARSAATQPNLPIDQGYEG